MSTVVIIAAILTLVAAVSIGSVAFVVLGVVDGVLRGFGHEDSE